LSRYLINSQLFLPFQPDYSMIQFYKTQLQSLLENREALQKAYNKTSTYRLVFLIIGLLCLIKAFSFNPYLGALALVVFLGGFYYLVKYHEKTEEDLHQNDNQQTLITNEIEVLNNEPNGIYSDGSDFSNPHHVFSADLDLFGPNSLFQLLNRAKTRWGVELLAKNMLEIESEADILQKKQEATTELKEKTTWRLKFLASLVSISNSLADSSHQISQITVPPKLALGSFLKYYGKIVPLVWIALFVGFYLIKFEGIGFGIGGLVLFHFYLNGLNKKITEPYLEQISVTGRALQSFSKAAELIANEEFSSKILKEALKDFPRADLKSKNPIEDFSLIVKRLEMRKNMIASLFLISARPFEPIETLKMSDWLKKNPDFFKEIFKGIAVLEYYASLGTISFNNPKWCLPNFHQENDRFISAKQIGHPLIKVHQTISNDFELNNHNRVNLITGSNMSGKSTLLRTIGMNIILANMGAPVFAQRLDLRLGMEPICYMRITDSIYENASTFKAEIERIKLVLQALKNSKLHIFLIDEMLRGTNSEDKLKGSMALFEKLVNENSIALLATHDLRLSEISAKHTDKVKNFYFEYSTTNGELIFDYLIKEGVCKSFNASLLLEAIGLKMS
jgi:MutS domain V